MRIRWTTPAAQDLTRISDYISERDGPSLARRVALTIYERVDTLTAFPRRGRPGRVPDTRELVISGLPYLAIYRLKGDVIEIARVLHGAQQWP
jgi:toxin ParE1/3/4